MAKRLTTVIRYRSFRLVARETTSRGLVGMVEWMQDPDTGLWRMHDAPWTVCDAGQHRPGNPLVVAA
ncbi:MULTISPECIES: hypothetical protein [unclassified Kitasatospora]|uniref:hypothetical protein n=1 Tax=unclassified Kitasatospora TaxID=2633591 RepID=UPI00340EFF64